MEHSSDGLPIAGEIGLANKGLTRSGEAYCLSCRHLVGKGSSKCPNCGSELQGEVRAFLCPKCRTVMVIGESQCPNCALKFEVKTLKRMEPVEDDKLLAKLMQWGKVPEGQKGAPAAGRPGHVPESSGPSEEQILRFARLKDSIKDLMANRSQMLERMEARLAEEKARLNQLSSADGKSSGAEEAEAEIMSLASEMADITMLQAHMESLSDEITVLMDSVELSEAAKARGLAARALHKQLESKEKELNELRAREEQLAKKENMVDRKIRAYAQKKRQLDRDEEELRKRLARLEAERAEIERLKSAASGGGQTEGEEKEAGEDWMEERRRFEERLRSLHSSVRTQRAEGKEPSEIEPAEVRMDKMIASLEKQIERLVSERAELQKKASEAAVVDEDLRRLLKVLDQMLGQLPEELIDWFSKSDEFALYERILDRFMV